MYRRLLTIAVCISIGAVSAQEATPPTVEPAILQSVEEKYSSEVSKGEALLAKAETELAKAQKLAGETRLKAYRDRLVEVTKTGDFDKALSVKARIEELEKALDGIDVGKRDPKRSAVKIIAASYGVNQSWSDVTGKVQELVQKGKPIHVSDELFGDPAPDYAPGNTLIVRFEYKGKVQLVAIFNGRPFNLP